MHTTSPAIVKRLKRAHGHLASVIEMIEVGRPCLDVAQQLLAVQSALTNAKRELIQDHLEHRLHDGLPGADPATALAEFKQLAKYL